MLKRLPSILVLLMALSTGVLAQTANPPTITVVAEGLYNPLGLAHLPNGNLLIAEEGTGKNDLSAGVSMMLPDGTIGRLVSTLPSSRDSGDLSGVPLVSVSPDESTIYIGNFNAQHLWTLPAADADTLPQMPYTPDDLGTTMEQLNNVLLVNPFDMTFDDKGIPVVTDASGNGVAKATETGTTRFFHRFDVLTDPLNAQMTIQAVPTGITRVQNRYYVTLFGGCPYPANSGELVAIDENRNQETIINNLNMPIDVAVGPDGTIWVLEFATFTPDASCFSGMGYRSHTGRLSRIENGQLVPVIDNLNFPGAVLPLPDGSLYVSEVFAGRILHVSFGETAASDTEIPLVEPGEPHYTHIADQDLALRAVINANNLHANPGSERAKPDPQLAALGRDLFFDPIMSGDKNIACAACHHPALAGGDARVLPIGTGGMGLSEARSYMQMISLSNDHLGFAHGEIANPFIGQLVPRNSPTIVNSALLPVQFWDGRVQSYALGQQVNTQEQGVNKLQMTDALAAQALFPITSTAEMAGATFGGEPPRFIRYRLIERLLGVPDYLARFKSIYGTNNIEPVQVVNAISAFEQEFIYTSSPWDDYVAGDTTALTDQQKRGALLFYGALNPDVNCASCHSGDLFTDFNYYNLLVPQIGPGKGNGLSHREDFGRANVTFDYRDQYAFRTPPLRNVSLTAPYFHSGAYDTLEDVIWHHANIVNSAENYDPASNLPPAYYSSVLPFDWARQGHSAAPQLMKGLPLSQQDVQDLVAFLESLTDPAAANLDSFIPSDVPSGLPLDPLPTPAPVMAQHSVQQASVAVDSADSLASTWHFANVAAEVGISFKQGAFATDIFADPVAMMGAGLCWIDYDRNGWLDLYLINSYAEEEVGYWAEHGGLPHNTLYRNDNGTFVDVSGSTHTDLSLRGNGCVVADFNDDGWDDIFVTADGPNALLMNNGDGTFTEAAAAAGIDAPDWNTAAAVTDLNGDGWLDLFVGSYIDLDNKIPNPIGAFPQDYWGIQDHLYLNNGANDTGTITFSEVTRDVGLLTDERTLGAIFSDLDNDGDPDLYLANDGQPNRLYQYEPADNKYGFHFVDTYETSGVNDRGSGMGVTSGDWTGDGWFDLMVTNWDKELNAIYRNESPDAGYMSFIYSTYRIGMVGLGNNMTGWGVRFADFDQDTDLDLLTVNGRVPVTNFAADAEYIRLYGNRMVEGFPGQFREWTRNVGLEDVGTLMARGSAVADFDNDGDLDIAINSIGGQAVILRNIAPAGNWLTVDLGQVKPGTRAEVTLADGRILQREVLTGSSYLASEDPRIHFGLGESDHIADLTLIFPDGQTLHYGEESANQIIEAYQHE